MYNRFLISMSFLYAIGSSKFKEYLILNLNNSGLKIKGHMIVLQKVWMMSLRSVAAIT